MGGATTVHVLIPARTGGHFAVGHDENLIVVDTKRHVSRDIRPCTTREAALGRSFVHWPAVVRPSYQGGLQRFTSHLASNLLPSTLALTLVQAFFVSTPRRCGQQTPIAGLDQAAGSTPSSPSRRREERQKAAVVAPCRDHLVPPAPHRAPFFFVATSL